MTLQNARDNIDLFHGQPMGIISDCLRGFMRAKPDHDLIGCDFSAIEARVIAWLAGEEKVLEIFRTHGKIYEATAAGIYGVPLEEISKEDFRRQIGKVSNLALNYGGGVGAFQSMAKNYGVKVPDQQADEIKLAWREANPAIVQFWYDLEKAAIDAVRNPGRETIAGIWNRPIKYKVSGSFLFCLLPSDRCIVYPYPKVEGVETPWGAIKDAVTYMGEDTFTRKWTRMKTYGGHFAENVTQAVARDLLAEAMLRLESNNYPIILHVHDEAVLEVKKDFGSVQEVESIMCELPAWATGLPVGGSGWRAERFRK